MELWRTPVIKLKDYNQLQNLQELTWYANFVKSLGVKRYLEIGSFKGDTLYAVLANSPQGSLGVSIDLNLSNILPMATELTHLGYKVNVLAGDSKEQSIIDQARDLGPYDLVLIDGDHTYDGVKADWSNYQNLAPVIAIHDTAGRDNEFTKDVYKFWEELKVDKKYIEVNFSNYQLGYGVIFR